MEWENRDERARFIQGITAMCEVFGKDMTEPGIKLYQFALKDLGIDDVLRAMGIACGTLKFFPKPVELRELVCGSAVDVAQVEAMKVLQAIADYGPYRSVVFDDPVTQAVIDQLGGWIKLGDEVDERGRNWFVNDFTKAYGAFSRQGIRRFGHLAGISEIDNGAKGLPQFIEPPAIVGNSLQAQSVLEGGKGQNGQRNIQALMSSVLEKSRQQSRTTAIDVLPLPKHEPEFRMFEDEDENRAYKRERIRRDGTC